eukprot:CAMPEP_0170741314 /NCGR_PEP_ID=MMETSP0437-20130122/6153_1 /TAXON_ID=0 /ORGANISM="Sexangularia sp." /LENGTH=541 /DNA_ID=CAMNT_0011079877 /DNA_START=323 /DNA_END=1949 /DNA_ORIENTATION=+
MLREREREKDKVRASERRANCGSAFSIDWLDDQLSAPCHSLGYCVGEEEREREWRGALMAGSPTSLLSLASAPSLSVHPSVVSSLTLSLSHPDDVDLCQRAINALGWGERQSETELLGLPRQSLPLVRDAEQETHDARAVDEQEGTAWVVATGDDVQAYADRLSSVLAAGPASAKQVQVEVEPPPRRTAHHRQRPPPPPPPPSQPSVPPPPPPPILINVVPSPPAVLPHTQLILASLAVSLAILFARDPLFSALSSTLLSFSDGATSTATWQLLQTRLWYLTKAQQMVSLAISFSLTASLTLALARSLKRVPVTSFLPGRAGGQPLVIQGEATFTTMALCLALSLGLHLMYHTVRYAFAAASSSPGSEGNMSFAAAVRSILGSQPTQVKWLQSTTTPLLLLPLLLTLSHSLATGSTVSPALALPLAMALLGFAFVDLVVDAVTLTEATRLGVHLDVLGLTLSPIRIVAAACAVMTPVAVSLSTLPAASVTLNLLSRLTRVSLALSFFANLEGHAYGSFITSKNETERDILQSAFPPSPQRR